MLRQLAHRLARPRHFRLVWRAGPTGRTLMDLLIIVGISVPSASSSASPSAFSPAPAAAPMPSSNPFDLLQTMPTFVYLLPSQLRHRRRLAVVATVLYAALPSSGCRPRHPLRCPSPCSRSDGPSGRPSATPARRPDPLANGPSSSALNQTTMAALSMATIASLRRRPRPGKPVLAGLRINVGNHPGPRVVANGDHARPGDHGERTRRRDRPRGRAIARAPRHTSVVRS